ncbi:hypothetical protein SAMN02745151_01631 [[Clostridium] propionicum DSM 1682]|uniref:Uncharacterized protein n=1 Tax=Anaerotignum propionicum DSM 1682 TaxID=991789 RepID=A0A0X1U799_ANAPI|nr:hypothetical protein CPRO_12200 [Anaerotignum propionicum DSM 1682]SHE74059.1 hypothetical protein SAMN02745151_01631 [[Clostridium] propionicum DSM 1682] [Anaerotignum propionicum DSM 1682]
MVRYCKRSEFPCMNHNRLKKMKEEFISRIGSYEQIERFFKMPNLPRVKTFRLGNKRVEII